MPDSSVMAIAHRGASHYAPENTTSAFDYAVRLGAPAIEFDLRLSCDGHPIVLHDANLDRTTSGRGPVSEWPLEELRKLDAGGWFSPAFAGQQIPTLEQALASIGPKVQNIIELKCSIEPEELLGPLGRRQALDRSTVISFDASWLVPVRQASRRLKIGLLADQWDAGLPEQACQLGATVLILAVEIMALERVEAAQDAGLEVWTYTANDVGLVAACAALGATGIITNRPDLIRTKQV